MLRAAVIVPIVFEQESPSVLFVRRAGHMRRNAGQIAFPGGLADAVDDDDLERTARREFTEEVGIAAERLDVLGRLPDVAVLNLTVNIAPFVAVLAGEPDPHIDRSEIDAALTIPLSDIASPGALHRGTELVGSNAVSTWIFDYGDVHIWGATARILASLLAVLSGEDAALAQALRAHGITLVR